MSSKRFCHLACRPERLSLFKILCREKEPLSHSHLILSVILFTFAPGIIFGEEQGPEEKPFKLSVSTHIFSSILTLLLGFAHHNSTVSSHKEPPWSLFTAFSSVFLTVYTWPSLAYKCQAQDSPYFQLSFLHYCLAQFFVSPHFMITLFYQSFFPTNVQLSN